MKEDRTRPTGLQSSRQGGNERRWRNAALVLACAIVALPASLSLAQLARTPDQPKRYVQDVMRERAADLARLLDDPDTYFYVCGLRAMEEGVVLALHDIAKQAGLNWDKVGTSLKQQARLHMETY